MDPGFFALLRCPACESVGLDGTNRRVVCPTCRQTFAYNGEYVDLLDIGMGVEPTPHRAEQRFMESELIANLYERFWRPGFVRVMGGKRASAATGGFAGEFFIHKNCLAMEERDGPWLDLSCGPGLFARAMAAGAPGDLIVGLDISRAMLEVATRRAKGYGNVAFVRGDAHTLPFASARFGGVNNAGALHAYDDVDRVFGEILRVLRPGGVYVGSAFSEQSSLLSRVTARVGGIRRFDPLELRAWLSRIGFADYEEMDVGGNLIFRVRKP